MIYYSLGTGGSLSSQIALGTSGEHFKVALSTVNHNIFRLNTLDHSYRHREVRGVGQGRPWPSQIDFSGQFVDLSEDIYTSGRQWTWVEKDQIASTGGGCRNKL